MSFDPKPATLTDKAVRLEPLRASHFAPLQEAAADSSIWTFLCGVDGSKPGVFRKWFDDALGGPDLPFAIINNETDSPVGSTRFMDIRREHYGMEIGWTWLNPSAQRTRINTEAKFLLLEYGFEVCRALRIQLKTDAQNLRSQKAIERIGATREGVHRMHMICEDGRVRNTVYYSIIAPEWPQVKEGLLRKLCAQT